MTSPNDLEDQLVDLNINTDGSGAEGPGCGREAFGRRSHKHGHGHHGHHGHHHKRGHHGPPCPGGFRHHHGPPHKFKHGRFPGGLMMMFGQHGPAPPPFGMSIGGDCGARGGGHWRRGCGRRDGSPEGGPEATFRRGFRAYGERCGHRAATDVVEEEGFYTIVVEVPGMARTQLKLTVEGRDLVLEGKRAAGDAEGSADTTARRREFKRTYVIPEDVVVEAVTAQLDHGLLLVTLPKLVTPVVEIEIQDASAPADAPAGSAKA